MIKFAVMTFMFKSWWKDGRVPHETMLKGFAEAGAEGVEPFHRDFVEEPDLAKRYLKILSDHNMKVAAVDVMCNLVYADNAQKQEGKDHLRQGLDICAELETEIAHVAGHRLRDGISPQDGKKMIAEGLVEVADFVKQHGMTLAIEDFNPSPDLVCSAKDCLDIMRLSNNVVKFVYDTGNFEAVGEKADANFDCLADHICHCHFKDFASDSSVPAGYRGCDLGTGMVPNQTVAKKLLDINYDGWVALETRPRNDVSPVDAVKKEMPLLQSWFEK